MWRRAGDVGCALGIVLIVGLQSEAVSKLPVSDVTIVQARTAHESSARRGAHGGPGDPRLPLRLPVFAVPGELLSFARTYPAAAALRDVSRLPQSRQLASNTPPPPLTPLKLLPPKQRRRPQSHSQMTDIRPANDWQFLMSGKLGGGQKRLVQRPWPEYVPESSAPIGRTWDACARRPRTTRARMLLPRDHSVPCAPAQTVSRSCTRPSRPNPRRWDMRGTRAELHELLSPPMRALVRASVVYWLIAWRTRARVSAAAV
jgi:hypothetical protein